MKVLLNKYLHQTIGMNLEKPFHVEAVELTAVEEGYFSVVHSLSGNVHHFNYHTIIQVIENPRGVAINTMFNQKNFPVVLSIGHLVEYVPA